MIKKIAILSVYLLFLTTHIGFAQEQKTISGKVTYKELPLPDVSVVNQNSKAFVKTDIDGNYQITAQVGDEISFSFVGLKTIQIVIEDVTSTLNIKMLEVVNQLDDIVLKAKVSKKRNSWLLENDNVEINTPFGIVNPKLSKHVITRIDGQKLPNTFTYEQALGIRVEGLRVHKGSFELRDGPVTYVLDNVPVERAELPDIRTVKDIYVIEDLRLIAMYTESHERYVMEAREKIAESNRNQNYYDETSIASELDISQNDLQRDEGEEKEIFGTLTHNSIPLQNVSVFVAGKKGRSYSDKEGKFRFKARVGDIVQYSHPNFEVGSFFVEKDAKEKNISMKKRLGSKKMISGKVVYRNKVLSDVHIINNSSKVAVKSDAEGDYQIPANIGDAIEFRYVGLKTVTITVEDVTRILNIKMMDELNQLDDVVVKANVTKKRNSVTLENEDITMHVSGLATVINLKKAPYRVWRFNVDRLNKAWGYGTALGGLKGSLRSDPSGDLVINGQKPMYIVDGMIEVREQLPDINLAADIYVEMGRPPKLIIFTINNPKYIQKKKEELAEKHRNQNFYDTASVPGKLDFSQNDVIFDLGEEREVYGKITQLETPVPDVMVSVAGKKNLRVFSDAQGNYKIKARVGDILQFTHASYETLSIFIEDVTEELNVALEERVRELEEVVVESNKIKGGVLAKKLQKDEKFDTSRGEFDPKRSGFSQTYVDGKDFSNVYENIQQAVVGKIPGLVYDRESQQVFSTRASSMSLTQSYPVAWEIDGLFTTNPPPLDLSQIKSVRFLRSLRASNRYGAQAAGGVMIVKTIYGNFNANTPKKNSFLAEYANSNFYENDAAISSLEIKEQNKFTQSLRGYNNKLKAYQFYEEELKEKITNFGDHIGAAIEFYEFYNDKRIATQILNDLALQHPNNPEVLKSIAYYHQFFGNKREAITSYERVFTLRPKHAQSFRDLANAYADYDLYDKAWKLYYSYILKGKVTSEEGIGELIYNDMEWLFYQRSHQTNIKQKFVPIHRNPKEFQRDVRMVFEWNTSEAEFELEFVSPDRRSYVFDHSLYANGDLITNEKNVGYSSKMFVIEDLGSNGDWLVNLTYKGNKKSVPTFLKLTTYYNWGKPNEKKNINVYKLEIQNQKASLLKFDREFEVFQKVAKN